MSRPLTILRIFVLSFVLVAAAPAVLAQADFSETVTFGDSLTHNDLLWLVYGTPSDLYGKDPMHAVFSKGAFPGDVLTSYAVGGSESGDIKAQIDVYFVARLFQTQGNATLFNFEIGGNDVLNNIGLLAANPPRVDPAADAVIDNIVTNMKRGLFRLRTNHTSAQFVVWTVPDVTVTPDQWNLNPTQKANVKAHLARINNKIRLLDGYPFVVVLDTEVILRYLVNNPPVLFGRTLVGPPAHGGYDHLFADVIHPTAVSNALLANVMIMRINNKWNDSIPLYTNEELADLAHIPH